MTITRPHTDEYSPYYADYVQRVPEEDIFDVLAEQIQTLHHLLTHLSEEQANFRPAPDEWSIKEVVGHLCDFERVFAYRALCFSRHESAPLPGFDQDAYVRESNYSDRMLADLIQEFEWLRRANLLAFKNLSAEAGLRRGTASGAEISVRALIYIMAGHVYQHLDSLQRAYLPSAISPESR